MKLTRIAAALLLLAPMAARAEMMADAKGMTLYTFDKDSAGTSVCYDDCAAKWPPYLVVAGETKAADWTEVDRKDGSKQWAYDGKPLYFFVEDTAKGDMKGDAMGGVWHVIND